jgi:hypothetical protein
MKLNTRSVVEVEEGGLQLESSTATINLTSLPLIFDMLGNMYQDSFGSIVRELTSNALDAHKAAGVDKPIIIESGSDDSGNFISFTDFGIGMNKHFLMNEFMNYGESTKRDTNDQIGMFGVGSKSGFSYTDSYYIISRKEGIECECLLHKGTTVPKIELINERPTDKQGTTVKIYYEKYEDKEKFREACETQLTYFSDVYFKNMGIYNNFVILEKRNFKYRPDNELEEMHICLGSVYYPINYRIINRKPIKIPVAIKFNIGDLEVTPSREAIKYNDKNIKLILDKINFTLYELSSLVPKTIELELHEGEKRIDDYYNVNLEGHILKIPKRSGAKLKTPEYVFKGTNIKFHDFSSLIQFEYPHVDSYYRNRHLRNLREGTVFTGHLSGLTRMQRKYFKSLSPTVISFTSIKYIKLYRILSGQSINKVNDVINIQKYIQSYIDSFPKLENIDVPEQFAIDNRTVLPNRKGKVKNYTVPHYNELADLNHGVCKLVVYGFKGQEKYLEFVSRIHPIKFVNVIKIHGYMKEMVSNDDRFVSVSAYFLNHKYFRNAATLVYLRTKRWYHAFEKSPNFFNTHLPYLVEDLNTLKEFKQNQMGRSMLDNDLGREVLEMATKDNLFNHPYKLLIDNIDRKIGKLKLINQIPLNYDEGTQEYFKAFRVALLPHKREKVHTPQLFLELT